MKSTNWIPLFYSPLKLIVLEVSFIFMSIGIRCIFKSAVIFYLSICKWLVPGHNISMRFSTKFENFANAEIPYMYHCHMLKHEDDGMMGLFVVVDKTGVEDIKGVSGITLFPNPSSLQYSTVSTNDPLKKIKA